MRKRNYYIVSLCYRYVETNERNGSAQTADRKMLNIIYLN